MRWQPLGGWEVFCQWDVRAQLSTPIGRGSCRQQVMTKVMTKGDEGDDHVEICCDKPDAESMYYSEYEYYSDDSD